MSQSLRARSPWVFESLALVAVFASVVGLSRFGTAQASAQSPSQASTAAASPTGTSEATKLGAVYGAAAGNLDGTLRFGPRPSAGMFYSSRVRPASDADRQQYRAAFEQAYRLSYEAALKAHKRVAPSAKSAPSQSSGK